MSVILRHPALLLATGLGSIGAAACGSRSRGGQGAPGPGAPEPVSQTRTEAVLVGPLCRSDACRCRKADQDAGAPTAGNKRFEVRLGSVDDPVWATVDGMVLYKSGDIPEACFYIDLQPGLHPVSLRGKAATEEGLNVAISIAEQGGAEDATWWYRTFEFQCGIPDRCELEALESWKQEVIALGGKHDPCGSTKVQGVGWETGRMPDRFHPDDLTLHFTLNVYKFTPEHPPGSVECATRGE